MMILDPLPSRRPLLLLHGFAGQPGAWDEVVAELDVAPVRVCLPGHGPEPAFVDGGFDDVVDALAGELEGAPPCDVAGYSLGARVGLGLVLRHPERARRALLVGVNPGLDDEGERRSRRAWDEAWACRIEDEGLDAFAAAWAELPLFATQRGLDEAKRRAQQRGRRRHTSAGLAWAMRTMGLGNMPSRWDGLRRLARPVTLAVGERDDKYVTLARRFAERTPRAKIQVVPGAGHNLPLEAPTALRAAMIALTVDP